MEQNPAHLLAIPQLMAAKFHHLAHPLTIQRLMEVKVPLPLDHLLATQPLMAPDLLLLPKVLTQPKVLLLKTQTELKVLLHLHLKTVAQHLKLPTQLVVRSEMEALV